MPILNPIFTTKRKAKVEGTVGVLREIELWIARRTRKEIDRDEFLRGYNELRDKLERTPEYAQFHSQVTFRARGMCEKEGCANPGQHVHHKIRVAVGPKFALDPTNALLLCAECHGKVDRLHKRMSRSWLTTK